MKKKKEKKDTVITIRTSSSVKKQIEQNAKAFDQSITDFLTDRGLNLNSFLGDYRTSVIIDFMVETQEMINRLENFIDEEIYHNVQEEFDLLCRRIEKRSL